MANSDILTKKIYKLLIVFSLPTILGMMVIASYNFIGNIYAGRLIDPKSISGITFFFPVVLTITALSSLNGIGLSTKLSLVLGNNNYTKAQQALSDSIIMAFVFGVLFSTICLLLYDKLCFILGNDIDAIKYGKRYSIIVISASFFQILNDTLRHAIRGLGKPTYSLFFILINFAVFILTLVVSSIFIRIELSSFGFSIVLSNFVTCILLLLYFKKKVHHFNLKIRTPDFKRVFELIKLGLPSFFYQITNCVIVFIINRLALKYGGNNGIIIIGLIISVYNIVFMPIIGIRQGIQPIIGYNFSAQSFHRVKQTIFISIKSVITICTLILAFILLFHGSIVSIFAQNDPEIVSLSSKGLRVFFASLPIMGIHIVVSSYYQAIGKVKVALSLVILRQIFLILPLLYMFTRAYGINGIFLAQPITDFMAATIAMVYFFSELKILNKATNLQITS